MLAEKTTVDERWRRCDAHWACLEPGWQAVVMPGCKHTTSSMNGVQLDDSNDAKEWHGMRRQSTVVDALSTVVDALCIDLCQNGYGTETHSQTWDTWAMGPWDACIPWDLHGIHASHGISMGYMHPMENSMGYMYAMEVSSGMAGNLPRPLASGRVEPKPTPSKKQEAIQIKSL